MMTATRWWTAIAILFAYAGVGSAQEIKYEVLRQKIIDRGTLDQKQLDEINEIVVKVKAGAKGDKATTIKVIIDDGAGGIKVLELDASKFYELDANILADKKADEPKKKEKKGEDKKKEKKPDEAKKDKKPYEKHDAAALNDSLREVINAGAKMFNPPYGDHAGCYRLYQGSLLSVKPFLSKELQGKVDAGIAKAEKMPAFADRAFELRRVIDEIRESTKAAGSKGEKIAPPLGDKGQVSGRLNFQGKPVAGGYFVTLVGSDGKKFSSAIQKNGDFNFATPIPTGEYRIAIEAVPTEVTVKGLPTRYASESTSGLAVRVQAGKQSVDLNLVK